MKHVRPEVFLIASPKVDWEEVARYLRQVGGERWLDLHDGECDAQDLVEFAGKMCYRSWQPGLNPNVRKVRDDQREYLRNILASRHGSVLEHASFTFVFSGVSRVFSHELVRHRPGTAVSQESLRYVRLEEIPMWIPDWALQDKDLMNQVGPVITMLENLQWWMADHWQLDSLPMHEKKAKTSFMRRFAPDGVATCVTWSANIRALRHLIEVRTDPGAEEEIRLVFAQVARIMQREVPILFGDFTEGEDGSWQPQWSKV